MKVATREPICNGNQAILSDVTWIVSRPWEVCDDNLIHTLVLVKRIVKSAVFSKNPVWLVGVIRFINILAQFSLPCWSFFQDIDYVYSILRIEVNRNPRKWASPNNSNYTLNKSSDILAIRRMLYFFRGSNSVISLRILSPSSIDLHPWWSGISRKSSAVVGNGIPGFTQTNRSDFRCWDPNTGETRWRLDLIMQPDSIWWPLVSAPNIFFIFQYYKSFVTR